MTIRLRTAVLVSAVAIALSASVTGCAVDGDIPVPTPTGDYAIGPGELMVGVVKADGVDAITIQPLLDYLARATGKKIEVVETSSQSDLARTEAERRVDIGLLSPVGYVAAIGAGAEVVPVAAVLPVGSADPAYSSVGIVAAGSAVHSMADLRGTRVCFTGGDSLAGALSPRYALTQAGLDPVHDLTSIEVEKPADLVHEVATGGCDAGFLAAWGTAPDPAAELEQAGTVREFVRTTIPAPVITVSTSLPASLRAGLATALDGLTVDGMAASGETVTEGFRELFAGFAAVPSAHFDYARALCAATSAACRAG